MSDAFNDMMKESDRLNRNPYVVRCTKCGAMYQSPTLDPVTPEECTYCRKKLDEVGR